MWFRFGFILMLVLAAAAGCVTVTRYDFQQQFGEPMPRTRQVEAIAGGQVDYWREVKPVMDNRCVVCHGGYDAPCQLRLESIEGLERGASKTPVYRGGRLVDTEPSRLFVDAEGPAQWRSKGFHSVLNEYPDSPLANRQASVLYQMLQLKQKQPSPAERLQSSANDFSPGRKQQCPQAENFLFFATRFPDRGMPYGLPKLPKSEYATLTRWVEQGARYLPRELNTSQYDADIRSWESFLNQDSLRGRLVSRYLYEHLYPANLYFSNRDIKQYFKVVRSSTPPGTPLAEITTLRPYDSPGTERVYYRLRPHLETIVAKSHLPYALNSRRMAKWRRWFFDRPYSVPELPGYDITTASNPFVTFKAIPEDSRYRFLLDEAHFSIMNFTKGPVSRGLLALNVINDHFWVFFVNPDSPWSTRTAEFFVDHQDKLQLPAGKASGLLRPDSAWNEFSALQKEFLAARAEFIQQHFKSGNLGLNVVWDGDGYNNNAALTVYRHFDSASVEKGLLGDSPKTAWLMGYSEMERLHYLLVAGFDVFGNTGHQLIARVYMDFIRMEAEANFLHLLPSPDRQREKALWYRDAGEEVKQFLVLPDENDGLEPDIYYQTIHKKNELYDLLRKKLRFVMAEDKQIDSSGSDSVLEPLRRLAALYGDAVAELPEVSFVELRSDDISRYFTLVRNSARKNIASLFREKHNRVRDEDELNVLQGLVGTSPNALYTVSTEHWVEFIDALSSLRSANDYRQIRDRFGVLRSDSRFWDFSDRLHRNYKQQNPIAYGLLDYNRLENR